MNRPTAAPAQVFDLALPALELEAGALVATHLVRGWWWGPAADLPVLARRAAVTADEEYRRDAWRPVARAAAELRNWHERCAARQSGANAPPFDPAIPTLLVVHALTGDMRAGGPGGWWERVIGPGRALDPQRARILCFNLLGSCYGTSGPADEGFPRRVDDRRFGPAAVAPKGDFALPEEHLPATVTTWDQARSIIQALDALGLVRVDLVTGGSLGAMIVLCLGALAPERFARLAPIGAAERSSPWAIGWNHVQRQALLLDPDFPSSPNRGLSLARQIGMMTYRAEEGMERQQGRRQIGEEAAWSSRAHYRMETYLEHQGEKLLGRFDSRSYLALLGAMDHHDLARAPFGLPAGGESWGESRLRAATLCMGIRSDQLFYPAAIHALAERLRARGVDARYAELDTPFGHDGFLIETDQMDALLQQALALPAAPENSR